MGIFSEDHKTSISLYVENLSNYEEIEWYQFQQLTEGITMQPYGAKEAIEAVRKKLKHGTVEQKLRVLEVLKLLMENSNQRFHRELVRNEKMIERFEIIIDSHMEDVKVRKMLVMLLGTWASKFQNEQGIHVLQRLYERRRSSFRQNTGGSSSSARRDSHDKEPQPKLITIGNNDDGPMFDRYNNNNSEKKRVPPPSRRNPPSFAHHYRSDALPPNDLSNQSPRNKQPSIDFEKLKPKIIQEVALANQSANNLVNALRRVNTSDENWENDMRRDKTIQQAFERCEEEQKKIVKYARVVEDEEWIGTLLSANEELLKALDMYDIMITGQVPSSLLGNDQTPLALLASPHHSLTEEEEEGNSRLSGLQLTQGGDTHIPRDKNGPILEDPFADPI